MEYDPQQFIMSIDVGNGLRELVISPNSDAHWLAQQFVQEQGLLPQAIDVLESTIRQHQKQLSRQREQYQQLREYLPSVDEEQSSGYTIQNNRNKESIFNRLHKDVLLLQNDPKGSSEIPEKKHPTFLQPAALSSSKEVYQYRINLQQRSSIQVVAPEQARIQAQQNEHSFRPYISERSQQIVAANKRNSQSISENLMEVGRLMQAKRESARNEKIIQEVAEYTFKPQINIISEKIMEEKNRNATEPIHEKLYQEAFSLQARRNNQQQIKQLQKSTISQPSNVPFLERMAISIEERQAKMNVQSQQESLLDEQTGQEYFKPQVGRAPLMNRNQDNLPIGDYLYQMKDTKLYKQQELLIRENDELKKSRARSNTRTNLIYDQAKQRALEDIFQLMDTDRDGLISASSVEISGFSSDVLQILAPLLCEMEQLQAQLNMEQFQQAAGRLIQSLNVSDRDKLLLHCKRKTINQIQPTFMPELNRKSLALATRSKSGDKITKEQKIECIRQEKNKKEMQECSFQPFLYKPLGSYSFMQPYQNDDD